jgi:hypothetical protein
MRLRTGQRQRLLRSLPLYRKEKYPARSETAAVNALPCLCRQMPDLFVKCLAPETVCDGIIFKACRRFL